MTLLYKVLGLMSGTSCDGLDIAYCSFCFTNEKWSFELLRGESIPYTKEHKKRLYKSYNYSAQELKKLDVDLGDYFGEEVNKEPRMDFKPCYLRYTVRRIHI